MSVTILSLFTGSAHCISATPWSSDTWGSCCLVCVRQPFAPKIRTVIPNLISAHWVLGCVQHTDGPCPHTCMCQSQLAIGAVIGFSDHCGWHSSETKNVNSNSAVDFFQESCKRDWMHFVCLASDYERTHNNDLTVHVKTLQLPRTFTLSCVLTLAIFLEVPMVDVIIFPRIWISQRFRDSSKDNMSANAEPGPKPAQLFWL